MNPPTKNQAHGGTSRPSAVTLKPGFKTNIALNTCKCTPASKTKPTLYQTHAALNGNGVN